jgi:hypothetical protein
MYLNQVRAIGTDTNLAPNTDTQMFLPLTTAPKPARKQHPKEPCMGCDKLTAIGFCRTCRVDMGIGMSAR